MKRKNTTRRALFTSVLSLLLCVSMLVGATFAWFTDKAESGMNTIAAGNLDVELYNDDGRVKADTELFLDVNGKAMLWEPGAVAYENLTVKNVGSLALKYAMSFTYGNENNLNGYTLSQVLKVAVLDEPVADGAAREDVLKLAKAANNGDLKTFAVSGALDGKTDADPVGVVIYWEPSDVDNNWNANNGQKTSDGEPLHIELGVKVEATQQMSESDSFGSDYDEDAEYPDNKWLGDIDVSWYNTTDTAFTLNTPAELAGLAAIVNGTATAPATTYSLRTATIQDSFANKTITLGDSMDLNNLSWTPIGNAKAVFDGTFDGANFTIYNLNVDQHTNAGLFGAVKVGEVKNVKIENATIRSHHYAGALVAWGYVDVDNCHATNVEVMCTPEVVEGGYKNGDKAGALVGWTGEGSSSVTNCTVTNASVYAYRDLGGLVGMAHNGCTVTGNTVTNVNLGYADDAVYAPNVDGDVNKNLGAVAGRKGTNVTDEGNTATGVGTVVETAEAMSAALDNGVSVTVVGDVELAIEEDLQLAEGQKITVASDAALTLDMGDSTLSGDIHKNNGHVIDNDGELTIKGGEVASTADNGGSAIRNDGTLVVEGTTLTGAPQATGSWPSYAVNNYGDITINDSTITAHHGGVSNGSGATAVLNNVTLTVYGFGGSSHCFYNSGDLTINSGSYTHMGKGDGTIISNSGTTTVNGGTYIVEGGAYGPALSKGTLTVNGGDFSDITKFFEWGGAAVVAGGSYGFDPAKYVADGYKVVESVSGKYVVLSNDVTITEDTSVAVSDAELDTAIADGATTVVLSSGNYIIPDSAQGKTLTIVGNGDTVVATQDDGSYEGCDYSLDGATVVFENITINTDSSTYTGYARLNATYKNCTINGTYTLYGNSIFENCEFNVSGDTYNIWTWGAPEATFTDCTFNTSGKAILLYGGTNTKLTVTNCVFNDDNAYADVNNKAAIEVGTDWSSDTKEIIATNCTVNGFDVTTKGTNTGSTLWGNKNSMSTDRLSVTINGEKVY